MLGRGDCPIITPGDRMPGCTCTAISHAPPLSLPWRCGIPARLVHLPRDHSPRRSRRDCVDDAVAALLCWRAFEEIVAQAPT